MCPPLANYTHGYNRFDSLLVASHAPLKRTYASKRYIVDTSENSFRLIASRLAVTTTYF